MIKTTTVDGVVFVDYPNMTEQDWEHAWQDLLEELRAQDPLILANSGPDFDVFLKLEARTKRVYDVVGPFFCMHGPNKTEWSQRMAETYLPELEMLSSKLDVLHDVCQERYQNQVHWTKEQNKLAQDTLLEFRKNGSHLQEADKDLLIEYNKQLSLLGLEFDKRMTEAGNEKIFFARDELEGVAADALPPLSEGKHAFSLTRTHYNTLMTSSNRDTRKRTHEAFAQRCMKNHITEPLVKEMLALRQKKAQLLGFDTYAAFALQGNMAEKPEHVEKLLHDVWGGMSQKAREEFAVVKAVAHEDGVENLEPWDIDYYFHKAKTSIYAFQDDELKPYLAFDKVERLALDAAQKLFDLTIEPIDAPSYDPSCSTYVVKRHGVVVGGLITDYQMREGKGPGAWMNSMFLQNQLFDQKPVVINVGSFYTTDPSTPLTLGDASTVFHELGHALHGLLSNVVYPSQSGTNVVRDFVELPSQLLENWITTKQGLLLAGVPEPLAQKVVQSESFGKGLEKMHFLQSAFFDYYVHTWNLDPNAPVAEWRARIMDHIQADPWMEPWHEIERFAHIWGGGYESGYYSYLWAEVIEADLFSLFEKDLFDAEGKKALDVLYSQGGSQKAQDLFFDMMGRDYQSDAFMARMGMSPPAKRPKMA